MAQGRVAAGLSASEEGEGYTMSPTAATELLEQLEPGETIEAVIFGRWGWGSYYEETNGPEPVPKTKQGKVLTWKQARPMMQSWVFIGGFGASHCYAVHVYTNRRVIWVHEYDGSTGFSSAPRNHIPHMPGMS